MKKLIFVFLICHWAPNDASPSVSPNSPLYITNGGSLALQCETDQDVGIVVWYRNGFSIIQITNTTVCDFRKLIIDTYNYSITCDQLRRFGFVKLGVNSSDHNTTWNCQVYSLNYTDLGTSSFVKVLMYVPVGSVKLQNGTALALIENQSAVLVCETNECRPNAFIYWMKDGINITDSPTNVTTLNVSSDLFVSRGTLTFTGQRGDNRKILTCGAYNGPDSFQTSGNLTVTIYYPPSILGLSSPYKVIEYQPISVTCQVSSNPAPDRIFWTPSGEGSVPSILYFSTVSRNNKGIYNCTAENTMIPTFGTRQNGTNTSQIQVDVLYSPSIQGLISPYKVIEYQPLNVSCQVSSNPPPDQISWSPSGEGSVPSRLYFSSVSRNQSGAYSCKAQNTMIPTVGIQQTGTSTSQIHVDVLYPPSIQGLTSPYTVIENQPLNVTCEANSNPPPDLISWSPSGEGSVPSRLYFSSVLRNNSGNYSCTAQNTMTPTAGTKQTGMNTSQIQVDVLYAAKITEFFAKGNVSEIMENSILQLYCRVDSNPYSVITLSFGDFIFISTSRGSHELIHIAIAGCLDAGKYFCSATNSVNSVTVSAEVSLKVQCGPRLDYRKNISTEYYRMLNDSATLEINVIAYPEPTDIMWYHRGAETDIWQQVPNQPTSSSGLFSSITVHLGSQGDFGDYLVNMSNIIGRYDLIFYVKPESPPHMVDIFYISRFIANQIELHFKSGFNGGRVQTFAIEYKSTANPGSLWKNSSVTDLKETQTTNGTYVVNITQPPPGTYEYRIYSWNDIGRSPYSEVITVFIPEGTCKTSCADTMENTNRIMFIVSVVLFCLTLCLFIATPVLIIRLRKGCNNNRSATDENTTDFELCQQKQNDDVSILQSGTTGGTRYGYENLNADTTNESEEPSSDHEYATPSNDLTSNEYEEPIKASNAMNIEKMVYMEDISGSERQSVSRNQL